MGVSVETRVLLKANKTFLFLNLKKARNTLPSYYLALLNRETTTGDKKQAARKCL